MKRSRQVRVGYLRHRQLEELPAFGDHDGVDHQHRRGPGAGGHRAGPQARQEADGGDQQQDHQRGGQAVLRVLAQQLVVEGGAGAARGGQPVARLAHVLRGKAALDRRGFRRQRGEIGLFARDWHKLTLVTHENRTRQPRRIILKTKLKSRLKTLVNDSLPAPLTGLFAACSAAGKTNEGRESPNEALRQRTGAKPAADAHFPRRKGHHAADRAGRHHGQAAQDAGIRRHQSACSGCPRWCSTTAR